MSNKTVDVKTAENIVVVDIRVRLWTGTKKLHRQDLRKVDPSLIPPKELISLGSKAIFDKKALRIFGNLKRASNRLVENTYGFPFLRGYAIPDNRETLEEVHQKLTEFQAAFNDAKTALLNDYEKTRDEYIERNKEWADIIRQVLVPKEDVDKAFSFHFTLTRVAPAIEGDDFQSNCNGMTDSLYTSIAKHAAESLKQDTGLQNRDKATQKALSPLKKIREKLQGLSFLDSSVQPLVEEIDSLLASIPKGAITDDNLKSLVTMMTVLSEPKQAMKLANGLINIRPLMVDNEATNDEGLSSFEENQPKVANSSFYF